MNKTQLTVGLTILISICLISTASALTTPHPLTGKIYQTNGRDYAVGATVSVTNSRTSEAMFDIVAASGYYENIDVANFPSGYESGDQVIIAASQYSQRIGGEMDVRIDSSSYQMTLPLTLRPSYVPEARYITMTTTTTSTLPLEVTTSIKVVYASLDPVLISPSGEITRPVPGTVPLTTVTVTTIPIKPPQQKNVIQQLIDAITNLFH